MTGSTGDRRRLSPDEWRRITAVLDRVSVLDPRVHADAIAEACRDEGISPDDVEPFLTAERAASALPEHLDPGILERAFRAFVSDATTRTLRSGTRIGAYEIVEAIGAGGMGEVYKARDTRLDRTVALKRLSADLATRPEGRLRLEREARAISRLNHPHICTLFDVVEQDGTGFLVMELVEGETLAARLQRGPLPTDDALRCGVQIADALAAAHRQNVVHRDLKPANIMLTPRGVKLLDFGLAALRDGDSIDVDPGVTATGAILGTPAYMAPEQLQGRPADARTDIFAFGAVIHEMLTGTRAFAGTGSAEVAAAILERDPEPLSRSESVPEGVVWAIRTCLARNPDERWQSAADLARHLHWIGASPTPIHQQRATSLVRAGMGWIVALLVITAVAVAALTRGLSMTRGQSVPRALARFAVHPPDGHSYYRMHALSPDGTRIAFVTAAANGQRWLWTRALDALAPQRLAATEGAANPFWSPDGRFIGFFANNVLKKVELATGNVETICRCDTGAGGGGTWNRDDVIVFSKGLVVSPLWRVPASGGVSVAITPFDPNAAPDIERVATNAWPQFLPDGRHFLWHTGARGAPGLYVGSLDSTDRVRIINESPRESRTAGTRGWFAGGYLFFLRQQALMAQRFSIERLQLVGDPIRVVEAVEQTAPGRSFFDVAAGVLTYQERSEERTTVRLAWFDRNGREVATIGSPTSFQGIALSPDGRYVLANSVSSGFVRVDVLSGIPTPIGLRGQSPVWAPDGKRFGLSGGRLGFPFPSIASLANPDDVNALSVPITGQAWPTDWSNDGRFIVGHALHADTGLDLWATDITTTPMTRRYLLKAPGDQQDQKISPDGRWVAYASNERSGTFEVYVRAFPEGPGLWRVSTAGGRLPTWTADGRELLYVAPDGTLMRSALTAGPEFNASTPESLFRHDALHWGFSRDAQFGRLYDVRDGRRVLIGVPVADPPPVPIIVVLNWEQLVGRPSER